MARGGTKNPKRGRNGKLGKTALPVLAGGRTQVPCLTCGLCCTYVTVEIDGPDDLQSATQILWHLYHDRVSVYVDDDEWLVQFETRCHHLKDDLKCAIYEQRPPICRSFDEATCEVNAAEVGRTFYTPAEFLAYLELHNKRMHSLIAKRYMPGAEHLRGKPQSTKRLPVERRFERLRQLGEPAPRKH